jgi:hypothetical protein
MAGNRAVATLLVQREADGAQVAITSRADAVAAEAKKQAAQHEGEEPPKPNRATTAQERGKQQAGFAQPDKVSGEKAKVVSAAADTKADAATPSKPVGAKPPGPPPAATGTGPAAEAASAATASQAKTAAASATAAALSAPEAPPEVAPPPVVEPLDSTGQRLPVDPAGDVAAGMVATRIAHLRFGAQQLAIDAVTNKARAQALRAGLAQAQGQIDEAKGSIATVKGHVASRRTVTDQAGKALETSAEKAAMVASEAPGMAAKADAGQQSSAPMAGESQKLANDSKGATPDDEEAAAKSQQQCGQITQVSGSLSTIDSAVGQTGNRARQLSEDADKAKADNSTSSATIEAARAKLDTTDGKLNELDGMNAAAQARVAGLADAPGEMDAGALAQQADADAVLANSVQHEARLHAVQESYRAQLAGLPGPPPERGQPIIDSGPPVQRAVAPAIGSAAGQGAAVAASRGERERLPQLGRCRGGHFRRPAVRDGTRRRRRQSAAAPAAGIERDQRCVRRQLRKPGQGRQSQAGAETDLLPDIFFARRDELAEVRAHPTARLRRPSGVRGRHRVGAQHDSQRRGEPLQRRAVEKRIPWATC